MTRENRRWLLVGTGGWVAIYLVATVDMAMQRLLAGQVVAEAWWDAARMGAVWTLPGAVLSAGVFPLFSVFIRREHPAWRRAAGYAGIGIGYWVGWATIQAGVLHYGVFFPAFEPTFRATLYWTLAGKAFNGLILFAAMAVIHAAHRNAEAVRIQDRQAGSVRAELARARAAALSAQLDPHFLFNTLHVASGMMTRDLNGSRRVLDDLRTLLSDSMSRDDGELVPLEAELRLVEGYLRIQRTRFADRLDVQVFVEPEVRATRVPPLLLQPAVENAIQHGIARIPEGGSIRITGSRREREVVIVVENDGARGDGPVVERVGLAGMRARLDLIFGPAAELRYCHLPAGGFRVLLVFPYLPAAATEPG